MLHDAAEDQGGEATLADIRNRFGDPVVAIVADCTDAWGGAKSAWRERKENYIAHLPEKAPASLLVSLADKTHNARAIVNDYRRLGDDLWPRFNGGKEGTLWYYQSLSAIYNETLPGALADELARTVRAFAQE